MGWVPPDSPAGPIQVYFIDNCGFLIAGAEWIVPMHCHPDEYDIGDAYQVLKERYPKSMLFRTRMEPQVLP